MKFDLGNHHLQTSELDIGLKGKGRDIVFISQRINSLKNYFRENPNDCKVARVLVQLVQRRKKLLAYLNSKDPQFFKQLTEMLINPITTPKA